MNTVELLGLVYAYVKCHLSVSNKYCHLKIDSWDYHVELKIIKRIWENVSFPQWEFETIADHPSSTYHGECSMKWKHWTMNVEVICQVRHHVQAETIAALYSETELVISWYHVKTCKFFLMVSEINPSLVTMFPTIPDLNFMIYLHHLLDCQ